MTMKIRSLTTMLKDDFTITAVSSQRQRLAEDRLDFYRISTVILIASTLSPFRIAQSRPCPPPL